MPLAGNASRSALGVALLVAASLTGACDLAYPEVVVINRLGEDVLLRNVRFQGCVWEGVLADGDATTPARCLPGEDRVHFEKLDAAAYAREAAEDGAIDGVCPCTVPADESDDAPPSAGPTWFPYQTAAVHHVDYGELRVVEVSADDLEQDFSAPGPYGH